MTQQDLKRKLRGSSEPQPGKEKATTAKKTNPKKTGKNQNKPAPQPPPPVAETEPEKDTGSEE